MNILSYLKNSVEFNEQQCGEDGHAFVSLAGFGKPVEHRTLILNNAATPANNANVLTSEITTFTFNSSDERKNLRISFISDPSNNANGPMGVAFTVNAGDDVTAASRLSLVTTDIDGRTFRIGRGGFIELKTSAAISRIDMTGILPGGTPAYAKDLIQMEAW